MLLTNLILALSLAADAFVVSLALGLKRSKLPYLGAVTIPLSFGIFQAIMPWIGWQIGAVVYARVAMVSHWIAVVLLLVVGINMIRAVFSTEEKKDIQISFSNIMMLGIATSIDALAIGFTLPAISNQPLITIAVIGSVTTVVCWVAFLGTSWIPKKLTIWAELGSGIILIGLACKILLSQFF